jgi:hypothetical protein
MTHEIHPWINARFDKGEEHYLKSSKTESRGTTPHAIWRSLVTD